MNLEIASRHVVTSLGIPSSMARVVSAALSSYAHLYPR